MRGLNKMNTLERGMKNGNVNNFICVHSNSIYGVILMIQRQAIRYNNKLIKMPFTIPNQDLDEERVLIANEYSDEKTYLPRFAVAVYNAIKQQERIAHNDYLLKDAAIKNMQRGLSWFQRHFTNEYYTLLD